MALDSKESLTEIEFEMLKAAYERESEERERLRPIRCNLERPGGPYVLEIYSLGDKYQVAEVKTRDGIWYVPCIEYQPLHQWCRTLERAVLVAFASRFDRNFSPAPYYIAKMLGMPLEDGEQ